MDYVADWRECGSSYKKVAGRELAVRSLVDVNKRVVLDHGASAGVFRWGNSGFGRCRSATCNAVTVSADDASHLSDKPASPTEPVSRTREGQRKAAPAEGSYFVRATRDVGHIFCCDSVSDSTEP